MTSICWWLVERLSRLLEPDEREAVRGDFEESGEPGAQALLGIIGLIARRYAAPWMHWQPWAAPLGLAAPLLLILGGRAVGEPWLGAVGLQLNTLWHAGARYQVGLPAVDDAVNLICISLLLVIWSWAGGFTFGSIARRLSWLHPVLIAFLLWVCGVPIVYLLRGVDPHRVPDVLLALSPEVVLFLIPLILGVHFGSCSASLSLRRTVLTAVVLLMLTVIMQIEDSRTTIAYDVWASGQSMDGRWVWTPHLTPFAAILWQVLIMAGISRWQRRSTAASSLELTD